jgi:hypothetical protein
MYCQRKRKGNPLALGQKSNQPLVREAGYGLDNLKCRSAEELAINPQWKAGYWGEISARDCGAVGGHMVRRMIAAAEQALINHATDQVQAALRSGAPTAGIHQMEQDALAGATGAYTRYGRV